MTIVFDLSPFSMAGIQRAPSSFHMKCDFCGLRYPHEKGHMICAASVWCLDHLFCHRVGKACPCCIKGDGRADVSADYRATFAAYNRESSMLRQQNRFCVETAKPSTAVHLGEDSDDRYTREQKILEQAFARTA
jgi:hypothetical protein